MAELDLGETRRTTWDDVEAWRREQARQARPELAPVPAESRRSVVVWRAMTSGERELARALARCRVQAASFDKRFIGTLATQAGAEQPLITDKQAAVLSKLGGTYRVQLSKLTPELAVVAPIRVGAAVVSSTGNVPRMVVDVYVLLPGSHVFIGSSKPVQGAPWFEIFGEPVSATPRQRKALHHFFGNAVVTERVREHGRFVKMPMVWRVCRARLDKVRSFEARSRYDDTRWVLPPALTSTLVVAASAALEQVELPPLPCGVTTPAVLERVRRTQRARSDMLARVEEVRAGIPWEEAHAHRETARIVQPGVRRG